jgi:hypothetical protein
MKISFLIFAVSVVCAPVAGYPAIVVATMVALFCMLVYVPSYVNTVLKLRSGAIPSLHDPYFVKLREQADNIVQNIGAASLRSLPPSLDVSLTYLLASCQATWSSHSWGLECSLLSLCFQ